MPFGLTNASAVFQALVKDILAIHFSTTSSLTTSTNILIFSKSPTQVPPNCLYIPLKVRAEVIYWAPSCNICSGVHLWLKMSENMLLLTLYVLKTNLVILHLPVC